MEAFARGEQSFGSLHFYASNGYKFDLEFPINFDIYQGDFRRLKTSLIYFLQNDRQPVVYGLCLTLTSSPGSCLFANTQRDKYVSAVDAILNSSRRLWPWILLTPVLLGSHCTMWTSQTWCGCPGLDLNNTIISQTTAGHRPSVNSIYILHIVINSGVKRIPARLRWQWQW